MRTITDAALIKGPKVIGFGIVTPSSEDYKTAKAYLSDDEVVLKNQNDGSHIVTIKLTRDNWYQDIKSHLKLLPIPILTVGLIDSNGVFSDIWEIPVSNFADFK